MIASPAGPTPLFDADDLLLYAESPFAFWMERSRFERGESGPPPDRGAPPREPTLVSQAGLRGSLPGSVQVVPWGSAESERRLATLEAMHAGVDWIVDGQLAQGEFSTPVNLLRREVEHPDGIRYQPCLTQALPENSARVHIHLFADLLEKLQGSITAELLLLRDGRVERVWSTDDWLPLFRAFRDHFLRAQSAFDLSLPPPDPGLSLCHGRWREQALARLRQSDETEVDAAPGLNSEAHCQERPFSEGLIEATSVSQALESHPLDTPGFSVLGSHRPGQREKTQAALGSVLNTRDALGE